MALRNDDTFKDFHLSGKTILSDYRYRLERISNLKVDQFVKVEPNMYVGNFSCYYSGNLKHENGTCFPKYEPLYMTSTEISGNRVTAYSKVTNYEYDAAHDNGYEQLWTVKKVDGKDYYTIQNGDTRGFLSLNPYFENKVYTSIYSLNSERFWNIDMVSGNKLSGIYTIRSLDGRYLTLTLNPDDTLNKIKCYGGDLLLVHNPTENQHRYWRFDLAPAEFYPEMVINLNEVNVIREKDATDEVRKKFDNVQIKRNEVNNPVYDYGVSTARENYNNSFPTCYVSNVEHENIYAAENRFLKRLNENLRSTVKDEAITFLHKMKLKLDLLENDVNRMHAEETAGQGSMCVAKINKALESDFEFIDIPHSDQQQSMETDDDMRCGPRCVSTCGSICLDTLNRKLAEAVGDEDDVDEDWLHHFNAQFGRIPREIDEEWLNDFIEKVNKIKRRDVEEIDEEWLRNFNAKFGKIPMKSNVTGKTDEDWLRKLNEKIGKVPKPRPYKRNAQWLKNINAKLNRV